MLVGDLTCTTHPLSGRGDQECLIVTSLGAVGFSKQCPFPSYGEHLVVLKDLQLTAQSKSTRRGKQRLPESLFLHVT